MLIRCEKCSTVYELDEKVLPAGGAPVQCSRCQYIFIATPGQPAAATPPPSAGMGGASGGEATSSPALARPDDVSTPDFPPSPGGARVEPTHAGPPPSRDGVAAALGATGASTPGAAAPPRAAAQRPEAGAEPLVAGASAPRSGAPGSSGLDAPIAAPASAARPAAQQPVHGPASGAGVPLFTPDGRPIRKVPFPDDNPAAAGPRAFARPMSVPPARSRTRALLRWIVPIAIIAIAVAAIAAWRLGVARRANSEAAQRRAQGQSLLRRDDRASIARAVVAFEEAARLDPRLFQARADRALAHALVLGFAEDEAERRALRGEALERAAAEVGAEHPSRAVLMAEASRLRGEAAGASGRAHKLAAEIGRDLAPLLREHGSDAAVLRAAALLAAIAQDPGQREAVRRASAAAPRGGDAWVDLAEAAGAARDTPEARAEGVARAEAVARAHPEMLRASLLLAWALARAGRVDEAVAAAEGLLTANPAHDDARALKAVLLAPPPAPPVRVEPVPAEAPAPGTPESPPRKTVSQAVAEPGR